VVKSGSTHRVLIPAYIPGSNPGGSSNERIIMDQASFFLLLGSCIFWSEVMWWVAKRKPERATFVIKVYKWILYFHAFLYVMSYSIGMFVNLYFESLYYFVIFPDRFHEIQLPENKESEGPVA
jgi:hypothetical protein